MAKGHPPNMSSKCGTFTINHHNRDERVRFRLLKDRVFFKQRFVDIQTLHDTGVFDGVSRLFSNIGWEKVLTLKPQESFLNLTLEFLHSLSFKKESQKLSFRLLNTVFLMSLDDINKHVGLSSEHTYGPNLGLRREKNKEFNAKLFWKHITGQDNYEA